MTVESFIHEAIPTEEIRREVVERIHPLYQLPLKELADYIPMLLEFLAVAPEEEKYDKLARRVAFAIHRISSNLPDDNPYKQQQYRSRNGYNKQ